MMKITTKTLNITSDWTRQVKIDQKPTSSDLQNHLTLIHENNAGFTENFALKCKDTNGRTGYEILMNMINYGHHFDVLDLACGSGLLLQMCSKKYGSNINFFGVDSSVAELRLAKKRLSKTAVQVMHGEAQNLHFIKDETVDLILCHWGLTLMDPVFPVIKTIRRIIKKGGIFSAIVDGDINKAPGYRKVHDIIYRHVSDRYPGYGSVDLGDPRVRDADKLHKLVSDVFLSSKIQINSLVLKYKALPETLAREVAGFFYASFVLSEEEHLLMIDDLTQYFKAIASDGNSLFYMPVNHLTVTAS